MKTSIQLAQLGPLEQLRTGRLARRLSQLMIGLVFYGVSMGMMIRGSLGLAPWDALHIGLTHYFPVSFAWVFITVSFLVLLLWVPLREIPGIGTIANAITIGVATDLTMRMLDTPDQFIGRLALTVGGVLLCGLGSALYIGVQLGRGPRDGLMTGLHRVTGLSLRLVRTALEVSVLLVGLLLGGVGLFGIGTILFALLIGPLTQAMLPWTMIAVDTAPPPAAGVPSA
ncbi:YczE/YyaS/YitT family protein [Castellaniella hirudinis]|uniref:membrane protein YczE n=1 Tax=Castellaniella hirudinis TaxID=1144617 RepID=UPI0039C0EDD2